MATNFPATILVTVKDRNTDQYSAMGLDNGQIGIWDHNRGVEMAQVTDWAHAAAILSTIQAQ